MIMKSLNVNLININNDIMIVQSQLNAMPIDATFNHDIYSVWYVSNIYKCIYINL